MRQALIETIHLVVGSDTWNQFQSSGRDWFKELKIRVCGIHLLGTRNNIVNILKVHEDVSDAKITGHKGPPVNFDLKGDATANSLQSQPVPFALRTAVEVELKTLENQGIFEPTKHLEWAIPVVVVRKKGGTIWLCGDYRSTVNKEAKAAVHPMLTIPEILTNLQNRLAPSTLDLAQAYQQLQLTTETADVLTINTAKGLYRVKRMPFGIAANTSDFLSIHESSTT